MSAPSASPRTLLRWPPARGMRPPAPPWSSAADWRGWRSPASCRAGCVPFWATGAPVRVVLVDRHEIGAAMGAGAATVRAALAASGVEARDHAGIAAVEADRVLLTDGTHIPARTVIFTTGAHASPLAGQLGVPRDRLGRVAVDAFMKVEGVADIYAAGDCAVAVADDLGHATVMSCQHGRPMGRLAGHNAVCDLAGRPQDRVAFSAPDYVTVMDLGPAGAVYTSGWDRSTLVAAGAAAKTVKQTINCNRIYPPVPATKDAMFAAAAPVLQAPPATK
jgi:NADH:ubiquinone reductase (H+-translocating)